ncbi:MAG: YeaH/YhbH family protein [Pseudomonadota bacterium]
MSYVIDRRENAKHKNMVNRRRFMERYKRHIREAVDSAVGRRSIRDMAHGEEVVIPAGDVSEPQFSHGGGGERTVVHPGNRRFTAGDRVARPQGGGGGAGEGDASDQGEGEDEFVFQLTRDEFMDVLFEGLELPNLTKRQLKGNCTSRLEHAGFSTDGVPAKLSISRTMKASRMRRIALNGKRRRELKALEVQLDALAPQEDELGRRRLQTRIDELRSGIRKVGFLDDTDLRYNLHIQKPQPTSQAVMFCLMDVSGSMDQSVKDMAKRFYLLLYLFLERHYERTEIVFIRHHTIAKEVDEREFFYSRETGGTVVSSALKMMRDIVAERYAPDEWNIYAAQASDGDNWNDDSPLCSKLLAEDILPLVQYFAYVEITQRDHQALWREYAALEGRFPESFAQEHIRSGDDIFPVFRSLFSRRDVGAA